MATFEVRIKQVDNGYVVVEAESRADAKVKAKELWYDGAVHWTDGDVQLSLAEEEACV